MVLWFRSVGRKAQPIFQWGIEEAGEWTRLCTFSTEWKKLWLSRGKETPLENGCQKLSCKTCIGQQGKAMKNCKAREWKVNKKTITWIIPRTIGRSTEAAGKVSSQRRKKIKECWIGSRPSGLENDVRSIDLESLLKAMMRGVCELQSL